MNRLMYLVLAVLSLLDDLVLLDSCCCCSIVAVNCTSAHTHNRLVALCQGAGTRINIHPLTPMRKKKKDSHKQQGLLWASEGCQIQLSQHTTKDGQIAGSDQQPAPLTTMDQYAGSPGHSTYCYVKITASFINFLHYCSPSSGFYGVGKDNRGRRTDNPSGHHSIRTISTRTSIISLFLRRTHFLPQPSQFILAWDRHRIMLAWIPSGLVNCTSACERQFILPKKC